MHSLSYPRFWFYLEGCEIASDAFMIQRVSLQSECVYELQLLDAIIQWDKVIKYIWEVAALKEKKTGIDENKEK